MTADGGDAGGQRRGMSGADPTRPDDEHSHAPRIGEDLAGVVTHGTQPVDQAAMHPPPPDRRGGSRRGAEDDGDHRPGRQPARRDGR